MIEKCAQPNDSWVKCCVCGEPVKTCERRVSVGGDYRCPAHPDGSQLESGDWVCSFDCWEKAVEATDD